MKARVFFCITLFTLLIVPSVIASPPLQTFDSPIIPPTEAPPLTDVLAKLASGVGAGAVLSFLFTKFKWFQNLSADIKWWIVFGTSIGLPLLAQFALQFVPADVWVALEPYWQSIALGFLTWAGTQAAHLMTKRR